MAKVGTFNIHRKGYPEAYHGTELQYQQGESVSEAIALGHFENEVALLNAAYGQFNIRLSESVKEGAAAGETKDQLAARLQGGRLLAEKRKGGGGGNPEALAKAKLVREAAKAAKAEMDNITSAAEQDPAIQAQWEKLQKMLGKKAAAQG